MSHYPWGEFQTIPSMYVAPFMVPIVSVYRVSKTRSRKAEQLTKPGNGTMDMKCMSVVISWVNKME